ncbi:hypothetical protein IPM44_03620 [bacterium]|nr:MAG: hypothetical protein IPM44_03620 [bacterium]
MPPRSPIPRRVDTGERDFVRESKVQLRRERRIERWLIISCIVAMAIGALLLLAASNAVSCTGQQTVKVYTGDTLNTLILGNVEGAMDDSVSFEQVRYLITEEQPKLNGTIYHGDAVQLPTSCRSAGFTSGWEKSRS